jgi:hypothetical protein
VVPSTSYEMDEAETFTIAERVDAQNFVLDRAFTFEHISIVETYNSTEFPMKCEVALLTRNVKIHGADEDSIDSKYGGHIMMMGTEAGGLRGRFSYAEWY